MATEAEILRKEGFNMRVNSAYLLANAVSSRSAVGGLKITIQTLHLCKHMLKQLLDLIVCHQHHRHISQVTSA